jgi:hypothetical protein
VVCQWAGPRAASRPRGGASPAGRA